MNFKIVILLCFGLHCQLSFSQNKKKSPEKKESDYSKSIRNTYGAASIYQTMLQTWCDGMMALQIKGGPDDGGLFSPSHQFVSGRCGDAVYPFLTLFHLTGKEKYKTAAVKLFNWSETHVSQPDGSWTNETGGKNDWKGITCFSTIALGEAIRHHGNLLTTTENIRWRERLRKGGDYILSSFTFETGDINYPIAASAALAVCKKVLGDEKYRQRASEFAAFGLKHITKNNLIWGEGVRGPNDTTPQGLRPVDIPYNMEESLTNLALYGTLMGDTKVLDIVTASMQAHLNWMLPDGGLDAGWCARQYKWNYSGTATGDGPAGGFALMGSRDKRFAEAAFRNLQLKKSFTHNGLLYGGADLFARQIPVFTHHTFSNAKGLAAAIDAGISEASAVSLPNDNSFGVREWPEANVVQVGLGPWRASVTTNDIASSPKRGGHPMGGALSMLWHKKTGPVAVASMNDYKLYEGTNMQKAKSDTDQYCLTPRIEISRNGNRYSNIYDSKARLTWFKKGDSIQLKIMGNLRDIKGDVSPDGSSAFEIYYTFKQHSFQMSVHVKAEGARLLFPIVSPASESVTHTTNKELIIQKKSARIKLTSKPLPEWNQVTGNRVFNFVPGFEAVVAENKLDDEGNAFIRIIVDE